MHAKLPMLRGGNQLSYQVVACLSKKQTELMQQTLPETPVSSRFVPFGPGPLETRDRPAQIKNALEEIPWTNDSEN